MQENLKQSCLKLRVSFYFHLNKNVLINQLDSVKIHYNFPRPEIDFALEGYLMGKVMMLVSKIEMVVLWMNLLKSISLWVWGAEYFEWNTLCGIARCAIILKYNRTISFSWSQFFKAFSCQNLKNASLCSCSSFTSFAFTSVSILTPAANCERGCSCERGEISFFVRFVTVFLFKVVLSGGASCSTSSSLNSFVSDSFALSFSCSSSSSSEFSSSFWCSVNDVSAGSEHRQSNPSLFVSLKIGLTILNHSGSSVKANPEPGFFLLVIFRHYCFKLLYLICKGFT